MKNNTLLALKAYLLLHANDKIDFLSTVKKIEKMPNIVRSDYVNTLLSLASGESKISKDSIGGNAAHS